jgi:hypothetical protein
LSCPTQETLLAFLSGELARGEREAIDRHLSGCPACRSEVDAVEELRRLAARVFGSMPARVQRRARRARTPRAWKQLVEETGLVAGLAVDTGREPIPPGARRSAPRSRSMLYSALGYDVTVRVVGERAGGARLLGQVLPGRDRTRDAVANLEIGLECGGRPVALATTNGMGEFAFGQLAAGDYTAYVELEEGLLVVPGVHLTKE